MADVDPFDLERFISAQTDKFAVALQELRAGLKQSHWMWFVFPQLRGLGVSPMAHRFGITGLEEARAYLAHPVLAPRLELTTAAVLDVVGRSLGEIFGSPDDMKFRSSMTLFEQAAGEGNPQFRAALDRFCGGRKDDRTVALLGQP